MSGVSYFVVVYDISCEKERSDVDKLLKGYGQRVQKSVFECPLTRRRYAALQKDLESIGLKSGFVKIYRIQYAVETPIIGRQPTESTPSGKPVDAGSAFIV